MANKNILRLVLWFLPSVCLLFHAPWAKPIIILKNIGNVDAGTEFEYPRYKQPAAEIWFSLERTH